MEQEDKKDTKNPPEESSNPQSSEKNDSSKDTNPAEGSSKPESSNKNTPQSLKAKSKIFNKSKAGKVQTISRKDSQQIGAKKKSRKNKTVVGNGDEPPKEKGEKDEENKEKESQNKSTNDKSPIQKRHRAKKIKIIKVDKSEQKQKNNEWHREPDRGTSNDICHTCYAFHFYIRFAYCDSIYVLFDFASSITKLRRGVQFLFC